MGTRKTMTQLPYNSFRCAALPTFSLRKIGTRYSPLPPLPFIGQNRNSATRPIPAGNLRKQGAAAGTAATRQFSLACLPCSGCCIHLNKEYTMSVYPVTRAHRIHKTLILPAVHSTFCELLHNINKSNSLSIRAHKNSSKGDVTSKSYAILNHIGLLVP